MKKSESIIISIIAVIILIIAVFLIRNILSNKKSSFNVTTTTKIIETMDGYNLIDQSNNYSLYEINEDTFEIKEHTINKTNHQLNINNKVILSDITLTGKLALYEDLLVIPVNYDNQVYDAVIYYDLSNDTYNIFELSDGLYVDVTNISFSEDSFDVVLKNVYDNQLLLNDNLVNICNLNISDEVVKETVSYSYDTNQNKFASSEVITKLTYESYISINKYCEEE